MGRTLAACLIFSAGAMAADAVRPHVAFAGGAGVAFGTMGIHAELLAFDHFAVFAGAGADLYGGGLPSIAAGARFFWGQRQGLMLSLQGAWFTSHTEGEVGTAEHADVSDSYLAGTVGWRVRLPTGVIAEAGLGLARRRFSRSGFEAFTGEVKGNCARSFQNYSCFERSLLPDLDLAFGYEF